jgi:hypothetical protein
MGVYMLCEHIKREAERENPFSSDVGGKKRNKSDISQEFAKKTPRKTLEDDADSSQIHHPASTCYHEHNENIRRRKKILFAPRERHTATREGEKKSRGTKETGTVYVDGLCAMLALLHMLMCVSSPCYFDWSLGSLPPALMCIDLSLNRSRGGSIGKYFRPPLGVCLFPSLLTSKSKAARKVSRNVLPTENPNHRLLTLGNFIIVEKCSLIKLSLPPKSNNNSGVESKKLLT